MGGRIFDLDPCSSAGWHDFCQILRENPNHRLQTDGVMSWQLGGGTVCVMLYGVSNLARLSRRIRNLDLRRYHYLAMELTHLPVGLSRYIYMRIRDGCQFDVVTA